MRAPVGQRFPRFSEWQEAWLEAHRSSWPWMVGLVKEHDVLPIYVGLADCLAVTREGRVVKFACDGPWPSTLREVDDEDEERFALVWGRALYPELGALLPRRAEGAPDCDQCSGSGKLRHPRFDALCPRCDGLGWME
ncbi:MAG: hypothetical protein AB2A00_35965 [Myxococcota bacterium]